MLRQTRFAAALMVAALPAAADNRPPGMISFEVPGATATDAHALYPAASGGTLMPFGGNPVWTAYPVQAGAKPRGMALPLVVVSHGMFGNRFNQTWLAMRLARAGYVVLAMDHPGTSTRSREPNLSRRLWERPRDLTRVIDAFLSDPARAAVIDREEIYAIGHSLGGFTVLAAAGARFDPDRFAAACEAEPEAVACSAFENLGVDPADRAEWQADVAEPRLKAIVTLDAGGMAGFTPASLEAIEVPVLMVAAGRTPEILDPSFESERISKLLPPALLTYVTLDEAGHFDFLGTCTEEGLDILRVEEPEDAVVCERGMAEREALHDRIAGKIIAFLGAQRR